MTGTRKHRDPFASSAYRNIGLCVLGCSCFVYWFWPVAIGMIWSAKAWTLGEKLVPTLVTPLLFASPVAARALHVNLESADGPALMFWIAALLSPFYIACFLAFRFGQRHARANSLAASDARQA